MSRLHAVPSFLWDEAHMASCWGTAAVYVQSGRYVFPGLQLVHFSHTHFHRKHLISRCPPLRAIFSTSQRLLSIWGHVVIVFPPPTQVCEFGPPQQGLYLGRNRSQLFSRVGKLDPEVPQGISSPWKMETFSCVYEHWNIDAKTASEDGNRQLWTNPN